VPSSTSSIDGWVEREPTVVVGRVLRAHGLRGEVAVEVRSDNPDRFAPGSTLFLEDGRALTVASARPHGARLLVTFAEATDRTAAERLLGLLLVVPESWAPDLPEGEYWPFQLRGCEIVTEAGRSLGILTEVIPNPANDLWVARVGDVETLVPAIRQVVVSVDVATKRIVVREVPGLTAPESAQGP
jgi:16S rRNA processing protein RimM